MTNIAEGYGRGSDGDFARFLDFARASVVEVQSLLFACLDTKRLTQESVNLLLAQADQAIGQIARFQDYLRNPKAREHEELYSE